VHEVIDDDIEIESAENWSQIGFQKSIQQTLKRELPPRHPDSTICG
jgi:hypothetical protein